MQKTLISLIRWVQAALLLTASLTALTAQAQAPAWQQALAFNQLDNGVSVARATAVNVAGDVVVTGYFSGQASFGGTLLTSVNNSLDVFVAKWSTSNSSWVWAVAGGGTGIDLGYGIALSGNSIYLTGGISNTIANAQAVQFGGTTLNGASTVSSYTDVFVAKYTDTGTAATFNWAVAGGGTAADGGNSIAVNGTHIYLTGYVANDNSNSNAVLFGGTTLNGASSTTSADILLARYTDNTISATFDWAKTSGGTAGDVGTSLAVSGTSLYLTGSIANTNTNANAVQFSGTTLNGTSATSYTDVFVAKFSDGTTFNGATLDWVVAGGGNASDQGNGIAVSGTGVYVTGSFDNSTTNANSAQFGGITLNGVSSSSSPDVFVVKYTDALTTATRNWAVAGGGDSSDQGNAIAVSGTGVYVTGFVTNTSSNASAVQFGGIAVAGVSPAEGNDVFVAKYTDATTTATSNWAVVGGGDGNGQTGNGQDAGYGLALSGSAVYAAIGVGSGFATFGSGIAPAVTATLGQLAISTGAWQAVAVPRPGGNSVVKATATNAAGDVFVTGSFRGQINFGSIVLNTRGSNDIFIAKWNTASSSWAWAVAGGGTFDDQGNGIVVNGTAVYVTGLFTNTPTNDRVARFGGTTLNGHDYGDYGDMFIAKYTDANTAATFNWAVAGGGSGTDGGNAIAVSGTGIYVTGSYANDTFNSNAVQFGGTTLTGLANGTLNTDVFVAKYTDAGTTATYKWVTAGGGFGADQGNGIAVNGSGVYVTGTFYNDNTDGGTVRFAGMVLNGASSAFSSDAFVVKYTDATTAATLTWAAVGGGTDIDEGNAIAVSGTGVFITGSFSNNGSNANAVQFGGTALTSSGNTTSPDVFVAKYSDAGTAATFNWVTSAGGSGDDEGSAIAVSGTGVYLTGSFTNNSTNTNSVRFGGAGLNGTTTTLNGDVFVARYTDMTTAAAFNWALGGGGSNSDQGKGIVLSGGKVFVGGLVNPAATFGSNILPLPVGNNVGLLAAVLDGPTITSFSPAYGTPGTTITLTGNNLGGTTSVRFNGGAGVTQTSLLSNTATSISVSIPAGASSGTLTVTTPNGSATTATALLILQNLTVTTNLTIPAGAYNNIIVQSPAVAVLSGDVQVFGALNIVNGATLLTSCYVVTGPGSFTLASGGTLGICSPAGIAATGPSGTTQVTGTRNFSTDASYVYNGSQTQITGSGLPATVRNLSVGSADLNLSNPLNVVQLVTLSGAGNLNLGGKALTLISALTNGAVGTAMIVNSGTGAVVGNTATQQRRLTTTNTGPGYRHYSSPMSGNTLADLATSTFTPVFNAFYNTSFAPINITPYPTVFGYDQSRLTMPITGVSAVDKGWYSPSTLGTSGNPPVSVPSAFITGRGYSVHLAGTEVVDFTGTPNTGTYTLTLPRNSGATAADAGWHLIGNPYPATMDWSRIPAADRPNVDGAIYVFQSTGPYSGSYRTYLNSVGGNSSFLGIAQGFFVHVSNGQTNGSLTFRNANRFTVYGEVPVGRGVADLRPTLQLSLANASGLADDFYLYAEAGATPGTDAEFDAVKLANPSGLNLASLNPGGDLLTIDGRPSLSGRIPLSVAVPATGSYSLTVAALLNLPATTAVMLSDVLTGRTIDLRSNPAYAFSALATAPATGRFFLNLTPAGTALSTAATVVIQSLTLYPNPAHNAVSVIGAKAGAAVEVFDMLGRRVAATTAEADGSAQLALPAELSTGVYLVRSGSQVQRLTVE